MKQEILQLTGGNSKGDRRELDYYPTPKEVTMALMDFLKLPEGSVVWEPACGDGAMGRVIERYGVKVVGSDIRVNDYGEQCDYMTATKHGVHAIITNPPFNLSEQFISKALTEADTVAMLLKSQYWHALKRVKLFEAHPPAWVLPLTWRPDFLEHERDPGKKGSPTMEVTWTVWIKGEINTRYKLLKRPTPCQ